MKKALTTTLNNIRKHSPCKDGWEKLLKNLGKTQADDEPLPYSVIIESNGIMDALWCCRAKPQYSKQWRLFAVWCARQVQHLMDDQRSIDALDVAERYANRQATAKELSAAGDAARDAAWDAARDAAVVAARNAAWDAARAAAWDAARAAAVVAARAAAVVAARAAAWDDARAAASSAAVAAAREKQKAKLIEIVGGEE
jgi:hypothetical protein